MFYLTTASTLILHSLLAAAAVQLLLQKHLKNKKDSIKNSGYLAVIKNPEFFFLFLNQ